MTSTTPPIDTHKNSSIAHVIEQYLHNGEEALLVQAFEISKALLSSIARTKGIIITEMQDEKGTQKLFECILYVSKSRVDETPDSSTQRIKDFISTKLLLKPDNYHEEIDAYLRFCAFSFLKEFAEGSSKAYFQMNIRIKKALKKLKESSSILNHRIKYWSASIKPTQYIDSKNYRVDTKLLISFAPQKINGRYYNISSSVKNFLLAPEHCNWAFSTSYLSTLFFNYFETSYQEVELDDETTALETSSLATVDDTTTQLIADDALDDFISRFDRDSPKDLQTLMAGFALFVKTCPQEFDNKLILQPPFKKLLAKTATTDSIRDFLNEIRLSHFNKMKVVERVTAHNRLKTFSAHYEAVLQDLDYKAKKALTNLLKKYLEELFYELGEKKHEST